MMNSTARYPIKWTEMLADVLTPIAKEMLKDPPKIRYYRVDGVNTCGQWAFQTRDFGQGVRPGTEMNKFHSGITNEISD
jgi:hypothetical protein